jgi:hypothetical protein
MPDTDPIERAVVLCHPHPLHGGNMHNGIIVSLAQALQQQRIATLRFNFRGTGQSTGTHGNGVAESHDVTAAIDYVLAGRTVSHLAVVGYSFGAAVGVLAGAADPRVSALVGVALPVSRIDTTRLQTCTKPTLLVVGDQDRLCPVDTMRDLVQQSTPTTALSVLANADHFFWGREPEVAQISVAFLQRVLAR